MTTPTEHAWREYQVFLRGPVGSNRFCFSTRDGYRSGLRYAPLVVAFPAPSDNAGDEFGILTGGGFSIEIADEMDNSDWFLLRPDGDSFLQLAGGGRLSLAY